MIAFFKEKTSSFCIFGFDLTSNKKTREENRSCHPGSPQPTVENNLKKKQFWRMKSFPTYLKNTWSNGEFASFFSTFWEDMSS